MVEFYTTENMVPENQQAAEEKAFPPLSPCLWLRGSGERGENRASSFKWLSETAGTQTCLCGCRLSRNRCFSTPCEDNPFLDLSDHKPLPGCSGYLYFHRQNRTPNLRLLLSKVGEHCWKPQMCALAFYMKQLQSLFSLLNAEFNLVIHIIKICDMP